MNQESQQISFNAARRRWLVILRAAISVFICGALVLIKTRGDGPAIHSAWFQTGLAAVGVYFTLAVIFYLARVSGRAVVFHLVTQVAADLALAICLTLITGGEASPFSFLFLIAIINSSFWGGLRTPLMVATFSATLWGGLLTIHGTELLTKFLPGGLAGLKAVAAPDDILSLRLNSILINTGACYLVAFLSGHLAGQLLLSRRALDTSQANLGRLADLNELIIQSIDSGLVTTSQDGLVLTVNRPGLKILGLTLEEMIGQPWWSLFLPGPARDIPLGNRLGPAAEAGGLRFKYARKSDGRDLTLELSVLALVNSSGETWGRLFVLKDLTSFIKMEEAVHKAEHLMALGEMAAGLAHELRTPLASLTGAWHMLAQDAPDQEDRRRLSGIIGREMDRLAKLTNDFLSFARPVRGKPGFFDLPALAADQLAVFSQTQRPGLHLESRFQPVPAAFFDRDHFCQIVWNLLTNAVEAGARQEKLNIIVETGRDPAWPRHIAFKVANDGPPIPPENRDRLFEPFFTTKSTGNGLGLATVSRLLHEGGGDITVDFTPSAFTTFTVFFPTAPRSAA